jgi:hypothetical protein
LEIGPIIFEITYAAPVDDVQQVDASETQILASSTTLPNLQVSSIEDLELSDRISEIDRLKSLDLLDTHRPGEALFNPADSGSKIVVLGEEPELPLPSVSSVFKADFVRSPKR